jgi:hypothetical protein
MEVEDITNVGAAVVEDISAEVAMAVEAVTEVKAEVVEGHFGAGRGGGVFSYRYCSGGVAGHYKVCSGCGVGS